MWLLLRSYMRVFHFCVCGSSQFSYISQRSAGRNFFPVPACTPCVRLRCGLWRSFHFFLIKREGARDRKSQEMRKRRSDGDNEQRHYYHIFVHELFLAHAGSRKTLSRTCIAGFVVHWYGRCAPHLPALYAEEAPFGRANSQQRHVARSGTPTTNKRHHGSINLAIKHILATRLLNGSRVLLYHRDAASRKKTLIPQERDSHCFLLLAEKRWRRRFSEQSSTARVALKFQRTRREFAAYGDGWSIEWRVTLIPVLCIERRDYYSDTFTRSSLEIVF